MKVAELLKKITKADEICRNVQKEKTGFFVHIHFIWSSFDDLINFFFKYIFAQKLKNFDQA